MPLNTHNPSITSKPSATICSSGPTAKEVLRCALHQQPWIYTHAAIPSHQLSSFTIIQTRSTRDRFAFNERSFGDAGLVGFDCNPAN